MVYKKIVNILNLLKGQSIADLIFDDFLLMDGKVYKKFNDVPYTGEIKIANGKDKFWMITNYKSGLPDGLYIRFFSNGSIMEKGFYDSGFKVGQWNGYYQDGSIDYTLTKIIKYMGTFLVQINIYYLQVIDIIEY